MFGPGDKLEYGHYTVLRELGAGGMGVVYHCRDEFLQREIAIKMLLPELMADDDTVEIFRQEARLAAQLEHPNIVTIHNIGIENKEGKVHHYIAMEYLPGGSLKQRIEHDDHIQLEQALEWMKQMTTGVNYAHKRGVVHQDIKPDNVFISHDGALKIGDFGLALIAKGVAVERAVQGKGTPAYMSPELCRGDLQDHRSDIYSLGAVFYELLTRERPYKAAGMIEMAMKHATAPVPSVKKINAQIPDVLDRAIQKMMAKAPEDRYQALSDVLTILEKLLLELQVARLGMQTTRSMTDSGIQRAIKIPEKPTPAAKSAEKPAPAKKAPEPAAKAPGKSAGTSMVDELDDLLDSLLAEKEHSTDKGAKAAPAERPKQQQPVQPPPDLEETQPRLAAPKGGAKSAAKAKRPANFNEDVTTDIDTVFQSRVRAESAAMAQAARIEREKAEMGKPIPGPAAAADAAGAAKAPAKGKSATAGPPKQQRLTMLWKFKTAGPIGWTSAPVLSRDRKRVYVASSDGCLYAIDAISGSQVWKHDTGAAIVASPAVTSEFIYVASSNGEIHGVTNEGNEIWRTATSSPLVSTPLLVGDDVVVASMDHSLRYLNHADGTIKWTYRTEGPLVSPPQLLDKMIFVTSKDRSLHAVSVDRGWRQWTFTTSAGIVASPLVSTDSVYIGSTDGHVYALEAESGKQIWKYATENPIVSRGTLEFTSVTVCSEDKYVHCIEKYTGVLVWKTRLHSPVMAELISSSGNLYVANREGWLQCFNLKNGELSWQMDCDARLESSPVVAGKTLYVGKVNGEVSAYNLP